MFWIVIPFIIVVGLFPEQSDAQECPGNPIDGFGCSAIGGPGDTGSVFTPSTALTPSPLLRRGIEQLREEEEEETGGGASADGQGLGFFVNGLAKFTDLDEERELGSDSDTYGVSLGADYAAERYVVGAALDYIREDTDFDDNAGNTDTNEFGIQLIGIVYPVGDLYFAGTTRFAYDDYDIERASGADGSPEGFKISVAGGPGYDFHLGRGFVVGVSGLLSWEWVHVDSYRESGADAATDLNLDYEDDDAYLLTSILELNAQKSLSMPWGVLIPEVVFRYLHEFEDDPRTIKAEVIEDPSFVV
ncbi:MAG TPA: autotransporter outer membrane beta-barrel domain-containing protein, partial [Nitrospira sp.]|nr:autotransporter outer membrane beta-barrel domain-containing protein [Nitrospira sp.]